MPLDNIEIPLVVKQWSTLFGNIIISLHKKLQYGDKEIAQWILNNSKQNTANMKFQCKINHKMLVIKSYVQSNRESG